MKQAYEEEWSPLRIGIGLAMILLLVCVVIFGLYISSKIEEQRSYKSSCLAFSTYHATYLRAISVGNPSLCEQTYRPVECTAELTGSIDGCLDLRTLRAEESCLFAATKTMTYCQDSPLICTARATNDPSVCDEKTGYEKIECVAIANNDADLYLSTKERACHDAAWYHVFSASPSLVNVPFGYLYDKFFIGSPD